MPFAHLSTVQHRVRLGAPLEFSVRHSDRTLLLARGHLIADAAQLDALLQRGALVDLDELSTPVDRVARASKEQLPALWATCLHDVDQALQAAHGSDFASALDTAVAPVLALVERDPDLAIFQVLRQGAGIDGAYGVQRSVQSAITGVLVAQRLGWDGDESRRVFNVALTMNVSMLELQGRLARQAAPPTVEQRQALATHPMRSREMLQAAGIADAAWLDAVLHHHEQEDGSGYPSGRTDASALASLVRRVDVYTAKLSSRATRDAMAADKAGRQMFMQDPGHPMTAALVKEFGIFPPGCHVRLASGELAIVVRRGGSLTTPIVACLTNDRGAPLPAPLRLDTGIRKHAVAAVVGEGSVNVRVSPERLAAL